MAPTEDFARKQQEAEALIRQYAPDRAHEELIALLQPGLFLKTTQTADAKIPIGASKFGGWPDVPEGFEWPVWNGRPLCFLAQINLEEIAPFDDDKQLPSNGLLWFFLSLDEKNPVWGEPEQFQGWRVLFGQSPLERVKPPADSHWLAPITVQRVGFGAGWALAKESVESEEWEEEEELNFQMEVLEPPSFRMLAPPYGPQLSPFIFAANGSQGKAGNELYEDNASVDEWNLLLQLDTCLSDFFEGINDLGWFYFLIHRDDLKRADFSRVWFNQ